MPTTNFIAKKEMKSSLGMLLKPNQATKQSNLVRVLQWNLIHCLRVNKKIHCHPRLYVVRVLPHINDDID